MPPGWKPGDQIPGLPEPAGAEPEAAATGGAGAPAAPVQPLLKALDFVLDFDPGQLEFMGNSEEEEEDSESDEESF